MNRVLIVLMLSICCVALLPAGAARADVFLLVVGGRIEGELLNPDEKPRQTFVVQVGDGGQITLAADQVQKVVPVEPAEHEYRRIRPQYADTVEGQWELAEWCYRQRLFTQRVAHLERIVELEPNHAKARRALGYSQIGGQWQKQDDLMQQRGFFRYNGAWLTKQQIELQENQRKQELVEREWMQKLNRWRDWMAKGNYAAARQNILAIQDPAAVKALAAALRSDRSLSARVLYVEVLAKIGTPEALRLLGITAIDDNEEEVRLTCLDYLQKMKRNPDVIAFFVGQLRSKDNKLVNRAAVALHRMKDPSTIGPLIDALVTTHKFKVVTGSPGQMSTGFGQGPGAPPGGLSVGGGPKIYVQHVQNQPVLDALVDLTKANFNFDERSWKYWHAAQKRPENFEGRRD